MHVAGLRDMALFGKIMTVDEYKARWLAIQRQSA
jgi:hypothetical protein